MRCISNPSGGSGPVRLSARPARQRPMRPTRPTPRRPAIESDAKTWSFSASAYTYLVPDSRDYVQPTITADRDWLHLEARYNYEALDTGSAWVGYNFGGGEKLAWEFTPMLGGVFGDTTGIAPGYKGSLSWWKLELYSEGEYVFDTRRFVGELLLQLVGADARPGGLAQVRPGDPAHPSLPDRPRHPARLPRWSFVSRQVSFTTYVFNPDESKPTVVLAVGVTF